MAEHHDKFMKHVIGFDVRVVKQIADWIPDRADAFLEMWLVAGAEALGETPPTSDATTSRNFAVALIGNLAWAATCLIPELKLAVAALSFGGAAVGSGTLAKDDAWPVKPINDQLTRARDLLSRRVHGQAKQLAATLVAEGVTEHEQRDKALWHHVFPNISYNSSSALLATMRYSIARAFKQYVVEYDKWLADTEAEANKIAAAGPHSTGYVLAKVGDMEAMKTHDRAIVEIRQKRPFKVHFEL